MVDSERTLLDELIAEWQRSWALAVQMVVDLTRLRAGREEDLLEFGEIEWSQGFIAFELKYRNVVFIALQEMARFEPKAVHIGTDADSLNGDGRPFADLILKVGVDDRTLP